MCVCFFVSLFICLFNCLFVCSEYNAAIDIPPLPRSANMTLQSRQDQCRTSVLGYINWVYQLDVSIGFINWVYRYTQFKYPSNILTPSFTYRINILGISIYPICKHDIAIKARTVQDLSINVHPSWWFPLVSSASFSTIRPTVALNCCIIVDTIIVGLSPEHLKSQGCYKPSTLTEISCHIFMWMLEFFWCSTKCMCLNCQINLS